MAATLGQPNRSCASCKKRKVKCDRKTPSCTACQKSKHRCQYTSYSPTVLAEETQFPAEDDVIRVIKQKFEEIDKQRWESLVRNLQPALAAKCLNQPQQEERNLGFPLPYYAEDDIYNLGLPVGVQQPLQPTLVNVPYQSSYVTPPIPTSPATSCDYVPYMRAIITLNLNLNAMSSLLGPEIVSLLQSVTNGEGPMIPLSGFSDIFQLQNWLRSKFLGQSWNDEMESIDERFDLQPIRDGSERSECQRFEVTLQRVEYTPSTSSVNGENFEYQQTEDFDAFNDFQDDKRNVNLNDYYNTPYSDSNRSSVVSEIDPAEIFINKIYAFVRRFKRNVLWLGENFLANSLARGTPAMTGFSTSDGVLSDVTVEVKSSNMQIPDEIAVKGRIFF